MWIVVTDLDGTLLNHEDYSWAGARDALAALEAHRIPVILSTSKTRAEVESLRGELGNPHPFIVENGAAIFLPEAKFACAPDAYPRRDGYAVAELGAPYASLVPALQRAAEESGCRVRGFATATDEEVAAWCGFSVEQAHLARLREYDEPFLVDEGNADALCLAIERQGYRWTRGGRFFHILGASDKGAAMKLLRQLYTAEGPAPRIAALGDSPNDLPMLAEADCPILIPSPRLPEMRQALPDAAVAPAPGSTGWGAAVLDLLPGWAAEG